LKRTEKLYVGLILALIGVLTLARGIHDAWSFAGLSWFQVVLVAGGIWLMMISIILVNQGVQLSTAELIRRQQQDDNNVRVRTEPSSDS
jgi:uncharacterized membrane protein